MHELPITQNIIKIAEEHARRANARRVTRVKLVVGDYSGFIGDSIQMYFDIISKGTMVDGATIEIEHIKPKLKCTRCGELFERKPFSFECPVCKGQGEPSEVGKEFYIDTIEVED